MMNAPWIASRRAFLIMLTCGVALAPARAGGPSNRGIAPPQSSPHGRSYAEWAAAWNQWAYSLPVTASPLFDTADLSAGQSGRVWFLGGTFSANPDPDDPSVLVSKADRTGTVPTGTALFFPVLSAEASVLEGNGSTPGELADTARYLMDHAVVMTASVDGRPVEDLGAYRVQSPPFIIGPLPEDNVFQEAFGIPTPAGTTTLSVADGVHLFVNPLPPGVHTIRFGGAIVFTEAEDGFDFTFRLDIRYTITVKPGR